MPRYKVAVCDDDAPSASAIKRLIEMVSEVEVVGLAYDGKTLMANIGNWQPDVVVIELDFHQNLPGVYYIEQLHRNYPHLSVLVWTRYEPDHPQVKAALEAGINSYILKGREYVQIRDLTKLLGKDVAIPV